MLGHSNAYQWLIINKICIVICHKLTILKSFVGKKQFIRGPKKVCEDCTFSNLHDVLLGTYWVNIICYNFIYFLKNHHPTSHICRKVQYNS
jgi:hypothetical protein